MPLLGRLLGLRPQPAPPPRKDSGPFEFTESQVRVLLFRESEKTGKRLLFDSSAVKKVPVESGERNHGRLCGKSDNTESSTPSKAQEFKYQYSPLNNDTNFLSEIIFGSVAMSFKGMSLKMHMLDTPERLMCTKVFCLSTRRNNRVYKSSESGPSSLDNQSSSSMSDHLNGLTLSTGGLSTMSNDRLSPTLYKEDSGICGDLSSRSSSSSYSNYDSSFSIDDFVDDHHDDMFIFPSIVNFSHTNSYDGLQWRMNQHICNSLKSSSLLSHNSTSNSENNSHSNTAESASQITTGFPSVKSKGKMGVAIVIHLTENVTNQMLRFLLEHAILLEAALDRLSNAIQQICRDQCSLISKMCHATDEATQWLIDLMTIPRLQSPLWISLAGSQNNGPRTLADNFLQDFLYLLDTMDTKETYFFMSTLITNVLTYHLGWVHSVSPYNVSLSKQQRELECLNTKHPYNPLWAQLGELYGAIGTPPRVSKTIVYGKRNIPLIQKILYVLSYFIRCGEIKRHTIYINPSTLENFENHDKNDTQLKYHKNQNISTTDGNKSVENIEMKTFASIKTLDNLSDKTSFIQNDSCMDASVLQPIQKEKVEKKSTLKRSKSLSTKLHNVDNARSLEEQSPDSNTDSTNTIVFMSNVGSTTENNENSLENGIFISKPEYNATASSNEVVFVLGENEALVGIKGNTVDVEQEFTANDPNISKSESHTRQLETNGNTSATNYEPVQINNCCAEKSLCKHSKTLKKHSGVKFEFDKYPKIVTNYMKSKNLELLDRHVIGKPGNLKIDGIEIEGTANLFVNHETSDICLNCSMNNQALQTPCNASELEFTCDIPSTTQATQYSHVLPKIVEPIEDKVELRTKNFVRKKAENTLIVNSISTGKAMSSTLSIQKVSKRKERPILELPMPSLTIKEDSLLRNCGYCHSLMCDVSDHYIADMVLQGFANESQNWELQIKRDLSLQNHAAPGGAACLFADIDEQNVKVWGSGGGAGGMSNLIATMLDTLSCMQKAKVPASQCLMFIESKLRELCIRSKTMAELLLNTNFCSMNFLIKSLNLEPNDVPLLLAIASTHSPQVAMKYGISFR